MILIVYTIETVEHTTLSIRERKERKVLRGDTDTPSYVDSAVVLDKPVASSLLEHNHTSCMHLETSAHTDIEVPWVRARCSSPIRACSPHEFLLNMTRTLFPGSASTRANYKVDI
jgi:hypothetical protein